MNAPSISMSPLPRGRNGLSPEFVADNQRKRLKAALADVLLEHGYAKTTLSMMSARAEVSKSDFYKRFETKDDCFVATYDDAVEWIGESLRAGSASGEWAAGVVDALASLLACLAGNPAQARLLLVEGLCAGRPIYDRYLEATQTLAPCFAEAPADGPRSASARESLDKAVVGGIVALLTRRVRSGETESLEDFLPEIAEFALTPYVGVAEARRIISQR
jgi:AcrR family transcriptional regulator